MERGILPVSVLAAFACFAATATSVRADSQLKEGRWRAWLDSPGGELPFGLELTRTGPNEWEAWLSNGKERQRATEVTWAAGTVTIGMAHYDAHLVAEADSRGTKLTGRWSRRGAGDAMHSLAFRAVAGDTRRFVGGSIGRPPSGSVAGRWSVQFESTKHPAVGLFEQDDDGRVTGTFMTATGDYRYLEGDFDGKLLRLSTFDGAHAFLFHARFDEAGTLSGDFWSRDRWHEKWTAERDASASLPDPFRMNRTVAAVKASEMTFRDLEGRMRTLSEPAFQGKLVLLEVFGSWCPNCHDAADFLVELDRRYRDAGLRIVGLAYELTGDFQRDARQVKRFRERHNIEFPLLVSGTSDKREARKTLPFIDRLLAYPTLIIMDDEYRIKAVHTGFSGPATGDAYEHFKEMMHDLIGDALLRSKKPWEE